MCSASMETSWYAFTHSNRTALYPLYTSLCTGKPNAIRKQISFLYSPFYERACCWAMLGEHEREMEDAEAGDLPSKVYRYEYDQGLFFPLSRHIPTLLGSRGKKVALEKLRISSRIDLIGLQRFFCYRGGLVQRGKEHFFLQMSMILRGKCQLLVLCTPLEVLWSFRCSLGRLVVLWCFVLNPHQPHAHLATRWR